MAVIQQIWNKNFPVEALPQDMIDILARIK